MGREATLGVATPPLLLDSSLRADGEDLGALDARVARALCHARVRADGTVVNRHLQHWPKQSQRERLGHLRAMEAAISSGDPTFVRLVADAVLTDSCESGASPQA